MIKSESVVVGMHYISTSKPAQTRVGINVKSALGGGGGG